MTIQIYLRKNIDASITKYCEATIISQDGKTMTFTTDGYLYRDIESSWLVEITNPADVLAPIECSQSQSPKPPHTYIATVDTSMQYTKPKQEPSSSSTETTATEPVHE